MAPRNTEFSNKWKKAYGVRFLEWTGCSKFKGWFVKIRIERVKLVDTGTVVCRLIPVSRGLKKVILSVRKGNVKIMQFVSKYGFPSWLTSMEQEFIKILDLVGVSKTLSFGRYFEVNQADVLPKSWSSRKGGHNWPSKVWKRSFHLKEKRVLLSLLVISSLNTFE